MELIEKIKNCEGCKRRRNFLKKMLAGIAGAFLIPWKSAKANECECIFCPGGKQFCLCCDPFCNHCFFINQGISLIVCEFCNGKTQCFGVGCGSGCPPGITCTDSKGNQSERKFDWYWRITLTDDQNIIIGSDDLNFNPMEWINAHKITNEEGKRITAKASHKFIPKENKA